MQKKSLLLALALGFSAPLWAQDVNINGTGVSVEANKAPVHTAKIRRRSPGCRRIITLRYRVNLPWRSRR